MSKRTLAAAAAFGALLCFVAPPAEAGGRVEGFAGYYFAEELEEDLAYGVRAAWDSGNGWGLMGSVELFETTDRSLIQSGPIGVWSQSDAITHYGSLLVGPPPR